MNIIRNNFRQFITKYDLDLLREEIQYELKKIEEIAGRLNQTLESKKDLKWWKYPDRTVLLKSGLDMNVLIRSAENVLMDLKKAMHFSKLINHEPMIYRMIHKITGIV